MKQNATDTELVEGLRAGDSSCFMAIVERYTQKVHSLSLRITRNEEDAEEVLQDVFVTVFRKIDKFEGKSAFSSWLYRITANTAFMLLRKKRQTPAVSLEELHPSIKENWADKTSNGSDANQQSTSHELRAVLEEAVKELPGDYRTIFILRDVDGLSNQDVSEMMSMSVPAVKSRLHRSRLLLRKKLHRYYADYRSNEILSYGKASNNEVGQWMM